jgi:hypothetical protein
VTIDSLVFAGLSHSLIGDPGAIDLWKRALAVLYGGFTEEVLMRFVLMTTVVWVLMKLSRVRVAKASHYLIAIGVTALLFAIGHLPVVSALGGLGLLSVTRVLLLNTMGGIVFGYLYWKEGLEAAIVAHLTTDVILLLLVPALI